LGGYGYSWHWQRSWLLAEADNHATHVVLCSCLVLHVSELQLTTARTNATKTSCDHSWNWYVSSTGQFVSDIAVFCAEKGR